jgi:hypothetical protein
MIMSLRLIGVASIALVCLAGASAQAGITTFSGQDDGVGITGPFTNSNATAANFLSAAGTFGAVRTETFDELAVGTAAFGGTFSIPGASVTIVTPFGNPYGGVSDSVSSGVYGFPISGANFLAFDGTGGQATFDFTHPTNSFGFYTTGVQTIFTTSLTVNFFDGASETLNLPINVNGGASYFGFTDTTAISSVVIANSSNDAWAIDNVSYNYSAVPEASTWVMMLIGFAGLGFAGYRASRQSVTFVA